MKHRTLLRLLCLLGLAAGSARAQQDDGPALAFHGFGTLGVAQSSTDQAEYIRDVSQPKGATRSLDFAVDSRLGIQANLHLNEAWELVVQALGSRRFDDTFKPTLTWAFLKWRTSDAVTIRTGRLGFDVYLLADSRNVGYSYLWVRPPVEYFGGIPITSFEGGDLVVHGPIASGFGSLKVFAGQAADRLPAVGGAVFDLKGSNLLGAHADVRIGDWAARAAWAQMKFRREFYAGVDDLLATLQSPVVAAVSPTAPALAEELAITGKWERYLSLGIRYEPGPFKFQLALSRTLSATPTLPGGHAGYLLLGYRMGAWTPYLNLGIAKTESEPRSTGLPDLGPFVPINQGVAMLLNANQNRQRTVSAGLRWDFQPNLCLKAQVDAIQNQDHSNQLWWRREASWNGRATVASLSLDFVF